MKSNALVLTERHKMEVQSYDLPKLLADEVLIRTEYSGVSQGTEIDAFRGLRPELSYPTVTGYQSVGIVEEVGPAVKNFVGGDRVLFTTSRLPDQFPFTWMASHVSHALVSTKSRSPIKLLPEIDPVEAALTAMVAVGLGGIQQIQVNLGDIVFVGGQGLVGQASAQLARSRGAIVVSADLSATRVRLSAENSADIAVDSNDTDIDEVLRDLSPGGVDAVIETTGRADQFAPSIDRLRPLGTLLLQGYYKEHIDIDFHPTHIKKPTIAAACGFGDMSLALSLLNWKKVQFRNLVTHLVPPTDAPDLFAKMEAGDPDILGVVFDWR